MLLAFTMKGVGMQAIRRGNRFLRDGSTIWRIACLVIIFSANLADVPAREFPEHIAPVELADMLWQVLPDAVQAVFVGPDDRVWYQLEHPAMKEDLPRVRRIIEEQFAKQSPQLFGVRPALFEASGRGWFITHSGTTLLGFKDREWIERAAPERQYFTGNCPNHGRKYRCGWNIEMGGTLFFPDSHGVHTFDGREWRYQRMLDPDTARGNRITILKEPAREAILAVTANFTPGVWRWVAGTWRPLEIKSDQVESVFPASDEGVWMLMKNNALEFLPFTPPATPPESFETLFGRLKSAGTDQERQAIGDEMIHLGTRAKADIERALGRTYDPEVLKHLVRALESVVTGRASIFIGPYEVGKAFLLYCESDTGRVFLRADKVSKQSEPLGKGLLVLNIPGGPAFFPGEELLQGWQSGYSEASGPVPARDGRGLWLETLGEERKARLLDTAAGRFVDAVPTSGFRWVHATRQDGTVFVGTREPGQSSVVLAAYRPGKKDARNLLRAVPHRLKESEEACGIDSTGAIWAVLDDGGMSRFDGGQWHPIPELKSDAGFRLLLPGDGRRMLGQSQQGFFYWSPGYFARRTDLKALIADHREDIVRYFGATADEARGHGTFVTGLVADKAGNVWLLESRKLSVLAGGKWINAKPALLAAGSRLGEVEYLNTVGGRGSVFVSDFMSVHSGGKSHFGRIENGQPVFSAAPHTCDRREMCRSIRDPQDRLWLAGSIRGSGGTCDWISGQLALPVADSGVVTEIKNEGWAALCDTAGNVWLGQVRGGQPNEYRIWRNGAIAGRVSVPTADESSRLVSDAAGSVYVWTLSGLYHLTAAGTSGGADFKVDRLYTVTDTPGSMEKLFLGAQGWLALYTHTGSSPRARYLCLVHLPTGREK